MKFLKAIMILAIAAGALSLGACAQHKETRRQHDDQQQHLLEVISTLVVRLRIALT